MQKFLYLFIILIFAFKSLAAEHKIEVSIDNSPITITDIKDRSRLMILSSGLPDVQKSYNMLHDKILEILIDEKLIKKEADKLNIKIDDSEISQALELLATRNNIQPNQLIPFFKSRSISEFEVRKQLWHQVAWSKIIANIIQPTINVSDREINENRIGIERRAKQAAEIAELKLAEIVLFYENEQDVEKNKLFAQKLYSQIKAGTSFSNLAREFSQTPSAGSDGVIGWISSNQMPPDIAARLLRLSINDIYVAYLPDGVHLLKLIDKKITTSSKKEITNEEIKHFLEERKLEVGIKTYLKKMRTNSHIQQYSK